MVKIVRVEVGYDGEDMVGSGHYEYAYNHVLSCGNMSCYVNIRIYVHISIYFIMYTYVWLVVKKVMFLFIQPLTVVHNQCL